MVFVSKTLGPNFKKAQMMKIKSIAVSVMLGMGSFSGFAQWSTQTMELKPGWNAVYLHVDASYATINELEGLDENIEEIWLWKPQVSDAQFIKSPDTPTNKKSRWLSWTKNLGSSSSLQRLVGNASYLVRYGTPDEAGDWAPSSNKDWAVKGQPVPPSYTWTSTGLNLIGFSTQDTTAPTIDSYFRQTALNDLEFFRYDGGGLDSTNPSEVFALRTAKVNRGEAFWVRSKEGQFNNYFGPFDLVLQDYRGLVFDKTRGQYRVIVRNRTSKGLVVTINHKSSESAPEKPSGQQAYAAGIKLLVRGDMDPTDATYGQSDLNVGGSQRVTLTAAGTPGSSREIIIGLDRTGFTDATGTIYGSLLEFEDSLGHSQVRVPVRATKGSNTGLWVGNAKIKEVRHDLVFFKKNPETKSIEVNAEGKAKILGTNDSYGRVPNPFPLRLILHQGSDSAGGLKLYQTIYHGVQKGAEQLTQTILTSKESDLEPTQLASARRVSAVHLPWKKEEASWSCAGEIAPGENVVVSVKTDYNDQSSNPFLHTYHPDHDNIDARYENELTQGVESFGIIRDIRLDFDPAPEDFDSLTRLQKRITGKYNEIVTLEGSGAEKTHYFTRGTFVLNRISSHPALGADGTQTIDTPGADLGSGSSYVPSFPQGNIGAKLYYSVNLLEALVPATLYEEGDDLPDGKSVGDVKTPEIPAVFEENALYAGVKGLTTNPKFPDSPDKLEELPYYEFPNLGNIDKAASGHKDQYGTLIQGYFHPDKTGWYKFAVSSEDEGQLWLSTDSSINNKRLIASASSEKPREYGTSSSQSDPVHLQRGRAYYIETIHRETTGADSISVSAHHGQTVSQIADFTDSDLPIAGKYLSPYVAPPAKPITEISEEEESEEDAGEGGE